MFITVPESMGELSGVYVHPILIPSLIDILGLHEFYESIHNISYSTVYKQVVASNNTIKTKSFSIKLQ